MSIGMLAPSSLTSNLLVDQKNGNEGIVHYKSVPENLFLYCGSGGCKDMWAGQSMKNKLFGLHSFKI